MSSKKRKNNKKTSKKQNTINDNNEPDSDLRDSLRDSMPTEENNNKITNNTNSNFDIEKEDKVDIDKIDEKEDISEKIKIDTVNDNSKVSKEKENINNINKDNTVKNVEMNKDFEGKSNKNENNINNTNGHNSKINYLNEKSDENLKEKENIKENEHKEPKESKEHKEIKEHIKEKVVCPIHKDNTKVGIDSKTFKLVCNECEIENKIKQVNSLTNSHFNNNNLNDNPSEVTDEDIFCSKHPKSDGSFYCTTCSEFVCEVCFLKEHKTHNCSLVEESALSYKENIFNLLQELNNLKQKIEIKVNDFNDINNKLKKIKDQSKDHINQLNINITNSFNVEKQKTNKEFEKLYSNSDIEVETLYRSLTNLLKKCSKFIEKITVFIQKIEKIEHSNKKVHQYTHYNACVEICKLFKESTSFNIESNKIIESINFTLSSNLFKQIKEGGDINSKKVLFEIEKFKRKSVKIEKDMISTVATGRSNHTIRMRRFSTYKTNKSYFNNAAVAISVNKSINIIALGVCSLHQLPGKKAHSIDVSVSIYDLENPNKPLLLLQEYDKISSTANDDDPLVYIYLKNSVWLRPNNIYLVSLKNLDQEKYQDFYLGEVFENLQIDKKKSLKEQNLEIICNTSKIKFEFSAAIGFESDFNEICCGLLGDLIYNN